MNTLPPHGSLSRHKHHGCDCEPCHTNYRAYENRRNRLRGYGTWQPLVDVQPARSHVSNLVAAGYTIHSIAAASGTDGGTLQRVLYGPNKTLRTETAKRLLALQASDMRLSENRTIDATGTRRRLQALVAIGWPVTHIARHIGTHPRPLTELTRAEHVSRRNAQRVGIAYRRLCALSPASDGVPRNQITAARRMAAARHWASPLAWDDNIDDPQAQPDLDGVTNRHRIAKRANPVEIAAEVRHLALLGESTFFIAKQLGRSEKRTDQLLPERMREAA